MESPARQRPGAGSYWRSILKVSSSISSLYSDTAQLASVGGAGTDYPLEAFATDVIEQMDALKVDKCALVGHSLGALVSSMVAQRQPDRVDRVLLEEMPVPRRVRQDPPPMRTYVDAIFMEVAAFAGRKRFDPKWCGRSAVSY